MDCSAICWLSGVSGGSKQARRFGIPDKRYQRDSKGRGPDHPYYSGSDREFVRDRSETSKAYLKELERHRGSRLPVTIRTWSRQDVAPIGRRFTGTGIEIDGMVTRETFTKSHLMRKGYVWEGQSDALVSDLNGDVTMYGWWFIDPDGCPTVAWSVDGCPTWKKKKTSDGDDMAEATVNLRETCGLTRLPIAPAFGGVVRAFGRAWDEAQARVRAAGDWRPDDGGVEF
jgi:hypothetical protein